MYHIRNFLFDKHVPWGNVSYVLLATVRTAFGSGERALEERVLGTATGARDVQLLTHRVNWRSGERVSGTATGARDVQLLERREIGRAGDPVNG